MNGTPWRTSTLRVLYIVEHDLSTRLKIRVWIQSLSRRLTLSPVSLPSLIESLPLELLRFLDSPHDVVCSDDESASHVCPFYENGDPGALLQTPGYKISLAASLG